MDRGAWWAAVFAPQTTRAGRKGPATGPAAPHADEWETRENHHQARQASLSLTRNPGRSLSPYHRDCCCGSGKMLQDTRRRRNSRAILRTEVTTQAFKRNGRQIAA